MPKEKPTTTIEHAVSVPAIDFAAWHRQHGITTVLFDIEGTITQWADPAVDPKVITALATAREHGIRHLGLVTNINSKHKTRVAEVAQQIKADTTRYPTSFGMRKPSGAMIVSSLDELGVDPRHCAFVGDKIVDILAARNAGVARVAWVQRHGTADHWFDRFVYRHVEKLFR